MPASSRAHLLLPSPQGLVHYDLVEETAFLGAAGRGGLFASPSPFAEAKAALRVEGGQFFVRALPGEAAPDVNGAPSTGAALRDGDRIRLGEQVALFRASTAAALVPPTLSPPAVSAAEAPGPTVGPTTAATPAAPRPRRPAGRVEAPAGTTSAARVLMLCGLLLLLFAAYRAVRLLETPGVPSVPPATSRMTEVSTPVVTRAQEQATKAFAEAEQYEADQLGDHEAAIARYTSIVRNFPTSPSARRASARIGEIWPRYAEKTWKKLVPEITAFSNQGKYRRVIAALDDFDARFSNTESAAIALSVREVARAEARAALDGLRQRAAPLIAVDPTRAYRVLTTSGLELPPDLEAELAALLAHVRELWTSPTAPPPDPTASGGPGRKPPGPVRPLSKPPGEEPGSPTPPAPPGSDREGMAKTVWLAAREALLAGKWADAKKGYASLVKEFKDTSIVMSAVDRIRAGRQAADAGLRGAAALVTEEGEWKDGKLTVEFPFEDDRAFTKDFEPLQPFPGDDATSAERREGMAILKDSTALLLNVVFDPSDVTWEMDCVSDEPRDFGLIGFQDGKEYRACAMHVGNTQFKLKKGAAATVLAGHVLWLFGDGAWKDTDDGNNRGFVRLAVRNGNQLRPDERFRVRAEIRNGQMIGEIHAKSDNVDLKGPLKGDDGRSIGPLRVGPFAFKGRVGVERFWVSGKVDEAWLKRTIDALIASETGPS